MLLLIGGRLIKFFFFSSSQSQQIPVFVCVESNVRCGLPTLNRFLPMFSYRTLKCYFMKSRHFYGPYMPYYTLPCRSITWYYTNHHTPQHTTAYHTIPCSSFLTLGWLWPVSPTLLPFLQHFPTSKQALLTIDLWEVTKQFLWRFLFCILINMSSRIKSFNIIKSMFCLVSWCPVLVSSCFVSFLTTESEQPKSVHSRHSWPVG